MGYDTRNAMDHFGDIAFNPLDTIVFNFLSALLINITGKWMNRNFQDVSYMALETMNQTVSRLTRLNPAQTGRREGLRSQTAF